MDMDKSASEEAGPSTSKLSSPSMARSLLRPDTSMGLYGVGALKGCNSAARRGSSSSAISFNNNDASEISHRRELSVDPNRTRSEEEEDEDPGLYGYKQPTSTSFPPGPYPVSGRSTFERPHVTSATPVPIIKIFPLCLARTAEGMIYSVILPYINQMIRGFGVKEEMVGVWSGMAESALMITEAISAPLFAPLADKYGRRPVFLTCVFLWGVGAVLFGLVKGVWATIITRGFLGLLAGAGVLSRTMTGELCDKSNRIRELSLLSAFAIFSPSLTVGMTLGPAVGGFLANPVPRVLPDSLTVFSTYPYLLPSLVVGGAGFAAWATGLIWLPETLPPSLGRSVESRNAEKAPRTGVGQLLRYKPFQHVLILYGITNGVLFSFEAIFPLFAFTSKELGGLGLPTDTIGVVLAISAGLSIFMTAFLFPFLHRAIPEDIYLILCLLSYPLATLFFPLLWLMHRSSPPSAGLGWATIGVMSVQMVLRRIGDFSTVLLDTVIFETLPSPNLLVMANSLTFSIGAVGRAIGPFIISYCFSFSTHFSPSYPLRQTVWVAFTLIGLPGAWLAWNVRKEADGIDGKEERSRGEDGEERVELMSRDLER